MRALFASLFWLVVIWYGADEAQAQAIVLPCVPSGTSCIPVSAANPLPTTGGVTTIVEGTTPITGGTDTRVQFNDAGVINGDAGLAYVKSTQTLTTGVGVFNSTTAVTVPTGSVAISGITGIPTIGANGEGIIWLTSGSGLHLSGKGSANDIAITNSAGSLTISVPTGTQTTVLGGALSAPSLTTVGTIAGSICATSTGTLLYESGATGCVISLISLKKDVKELDWQEATADIMALKPISYAMKDRPNQIRLGFFAENTKEADERFATYDGKGDLQAYDPNAILSAAVALLQKQQACLDSWKCRLFGWR